MNNIAESTKPLNIEVILEASRTTGRWHLPVTQRAFEWKREQVASLADSVLLGFPIGSLLIANHDSDYYVFDPSEKVRKRVEGGGEYKELVLDGQQRCTALLIAFDGEPYPDAGDREGKHLWINVLEHDADFTEFNEKMARKYIYFWHKMPGEEDDPGLNNLSSGERKLVGLKRNKPKRGWIPLSTLYEQDPDNADKDELAEMAGLKADDSHNVLEEILQRIKRAKTRRNIPVLHLEPEHHEDALAHLHQVFIRLNTSGTVLTPLDVFFAGVKKFWPDAEEHVAKVIDMSHGLLSRKNAITLIARCAAKTLDEERNPTRLDAKLLSAFTQKGGTNKLVDRMREITPEDGSSLFERSVDKVCGLLQTKLHAGAYNLYTEAIAAAVGWTMSHTEKTQKLKISTHSRRAIIGFAFWTSFYSVRKGRDRFGRRTFRLAWDAGKSGEPFPDFNSEDMWKVCFAHQMVLVHLPQKLPRLICLGEGKRYKDSWIIEDGLRSARALSLGVFQKLKHSPIDWDHILADNFGRKNWRDRHGLHKAVYLLGSTANFAGIDASANRVLQDRSPTSKLRTGDKSYCNRDFIKTEPNLLEEEEKLLFAVEKNLKKGKMDGAHRKMRRFVEARSQRIWDDLIRVAGKPPLKRD